MLEAFLHIYCKYYYLLLFTQTLIQILRNNGCGIPELFFFGLSSSLLHHPPFLYSRCPISMIFLNDLKEKFQHRMSTRYVALKLLGKRKKLEGKEGKDRRGVKAQQQLPRTIINHQERDNRIVQPTGEQLSLQWALTVHVTRCYCNFTKKGKGHCRKSIA